MHDEFPASLENLYEMLQFIQKHAHQVGFDTETISKIELAVEEALVNIIKHGRVKRFGTIRISCEQSEKKGLKIILIDSGVPYNPLAHFNEIDPFVKLNQGEVGGYGIYFIRKIIDQMDYQRADGCNILTLIKYCS